MEEKAGKDVEQLLETTVENKQIIFTGYIEGIPKETDMELRIEKKMNLEKVPKGSNGLLVKNLYLSCDPFMRGRMRDFTGSYLPPFSLGEVIEGFGVSKVLDSDNPDFKPGDIISGFTGWEEYSLIYKTEQLRKIQVDDMPLSYHVGLLGMACQVSQLMLDFMRFAHLKEAIMFLSLLLRSSWSACWPTREGTRMLRRRKCRDKTKVDILKDKLGFDGAFNYKEKADLDKALKRHFPEGIDIYFDNVGGSMLDAALLNMRSHGRIAICGMVSQQSLSNPQGIYNLFQLIAKRVRMQGFLQSDYLHLFPRFLEDVTSLYKQGNITYLEDMNEGLESGPSAFVGLFAGRNIGKQVIRVAHN